MFYRMSDELEKPGAFAERERDLSDLDSPVAQWNLKDDAFPDFEPEFTPVLLSDDSSLVDFVHDGNAIGGQGLLISDKVLKILGKLRLPPHRHYPLEVVHQEKTVRDGYFWLQILNMDNYHWIDFSKSAFSTKHKFDMDDGSGEPVKIRNAEELKKTIETMKDTFVLFSKLTLNDAYAKDPFDLFYFDRLGGLSYLNPIVNEKLKTEFEKNNVVGYRLRKLENIHIDK